MHPRVLLGFHRNDHRVRLPGAQSGHMGDERSGPVRTTIIRMGGATSATSKIDVLRVNSNTSTCDFHASHVKPRSGILALNSRLDGPSSGDSPPRTRNEACAITTSAVVDPGDDEFTAVENPMVVAGRGDSRARRGRSCWGFQRR